MNLFRKAIRSNFDILKIKGYVTSRLKNWVVRMRHHSGLYVVKLPTADELYLNFSRDHVAIIESELRKITLYLQQANDLKLYNEILHKFVPKMNIDFEQTQFTGYGAGTAGLNVYRKVIDGDKVLFEKVLFNSSKVLLRTKWFYDNIFSSLNENIKVPTLHKLIEGKLITAVYFEFINFVSLIPQNVDKTVFSLSREMYLLSLTTDMKNKMKNAPDCIKDFKVYRHYKSNIEKAEQKAIELFGDKYPVRAIDKLIKDSPHILTHGDIHGNNACEGNYLIDWDSFGIYPVGLDVANILFRCKNFKLSYKDLTHLLVTEYGTTILEEEWDDFELNCLYFYYVFTIDKLTKTGLSGVQIDILKRIIELHYNKKNLLSTV